MTDDEAGGLLNSLLEEAADVVVVDGEYQRGGVTFAARPAENFVELLLGEEIGEAAMRTPDTSVSDRGRGWVRFAPPQWDDHALDRLEAWFLVAWRLAAHDRR